MIDTRAKLIQAAADTLREHGVAAASARTIARRAGVNQALIFYHFGTVSQLVEAACRHAVDTAAERYRCRLDKVTTLPGLLEVGRELHESERAVGNVAMMGQVMSGAVGDPVLARAGKYAMSLWVREIELVVTRVLDGSPVADVIDTNGVARAIGAAFIGLEFYDGVDREGAALALASLERLGILVEILNDLGPATRRALRSKLKRARVAAATRH